MTIFTADIMGLSSQPKSGLKILSVHNRGLTRNKVLVLTAVLQLTAANLRYTHKTSVFKTSGFKTSGFKMSETSGLQNVRFTKRQVYKMSGLQNVRSSNRPVAKKHP
jgi:hypothetical protein